MGLAGILLALHPGVAIAQQGEASGGGTGAPSVATQDAEPIAGTETELQAPRLAGWVFLPGVTYTPDHGLTLAGAALRYFKTEARTARVSHVVLTAEGSLEGRGMVSFDPNVWFDGGRFHLGGTALVSYLDYSYFGLGNDTRMADGEDYTAVRGTVRPEGVMRIARSLYGGVVYEFRHENITALEEGGAIDSGMVAGDGEGTVVSGIGGLVRWDSRDHSFSPRSGGLITLSPRVYGSFLGSDHDFTRLLLEASWFFGLGGDHVLAVDGRVDLRGGDPPFSYMAYAGGSRLLRGMLEGRFRDRHFAGAQVEYRFPLFWRFGGVAFGGLGRVASELSEFALTDLKYSAGGGLRFAIQQDERITVRLDVAKSNDDSAFYFALLEAF
ncbi:MAG TPA: BamA/TamA family outer membrane protein [Kofleriaceae bacterium]|nr:BamA/TamA family outer membrane protein [Kofleriaceae bacterium]